ncbi:hypothetical protein BEWA_042490 [Theileria equi strain WA]|uniref:Uncharacterized protein n=1 Tax=Theileria equi strain WA TaxID=1537102 RepID=L1LFS9_THEEQ|nr:hypothetical protein BEWA_042490 [Theileria equi strain WA]EKX74211.1 hypothetical protein BEWA_042490 [Theileria equi strain WA]|eukprot:XP_004833663.1 hypothetical protein BEWA_042490 [Theileria equi strain WA]
MSNETDTDSERKLVDIDISQAQDNGSYTDTCNNTINIHKVDNKPEKGYKRYTHIPLTGSYSISGINYSGEKQGGIDLSGDYKKKVTVYYLSYDVTNALPLIVGLEKDWGNNYYYYTRTNLSIFSSWKDEGVEVTSENQLLSKLTAITSQLHELVVLNLTETNDTYFANGDPRSHPETNTDTTISVSFSETIHTIYKRYKHSPVTKDISAIRLLSTKTTSTNIPFESPIYRNEYSEAHVYFWEGDNRHRNPLLLELKLTTSTFHSYYILSDGETDKKWKTESGITANTLRENLNKQNCGRNSAHIVKISEKGSSGGGTSYNCPSCSLKQVRVTKYDASDYSYSHHISEGFSRFEDKKTEHTGFTFTARIYSVYVYWYPSGPEGIPLLIYLQESNKWYQRQTLDSTKWTDVPRDKKPSDYKDDPTKIQGLLKDILPTVTINVGEGKQLTSGGSGEYEDPSGEGEEKEQIKVTRKDIEVDGGTVKYTSFTHCILKKDGFILGGIKYDESTTLSGITSSDILKHVTAYYYKGVSNFKFEDLLMIGFEKRGACSNNYAYYSRDDKGSTWTLLPDQKSELENPGLTQKLTEIKKKLEAEKNKSQNGAAGGHSSASSQNFGDRILKFIKSYPAEIGITGGLATVVTIVGIVKKFWGTIATILITSV